MKRHLQNSCRAVLRPIARAARKALTPDEAPITFDWHLIEHGVASGCNLLLPKNQPITSMICSGEYEAEIMRFVNKLVNANACCFDIGGHYGYYTMALSAIATEGAVHTFEPVPDHAIRIQQGVERSSLPETRVHQVAVAKECGEMKLRFAGEGSDDSMAYLDEYGGVDTEAAKINYQQFRETVVPTISIDRAAHLHGTPDFIKIDAEGAEGAILEGGLQTIPTAKPRLLIEVHGIHEALHCSDVLNAIDYQAILLSKQKTTLPVLWVHRSDTGAIEAARSILGTAPTRFFSR